MYGIVFFSTSSATQPNYYFEHLFRFWILFWPKTDWKVKISKSCFHYFVTAKIRNMMEHLLHDWIHNNRWLCKGKQCLFERISTNYGNIVHNIYANPNTFFTIQIVFYWLLGQISNNLHHSKCVLYIGMCTIFLPKDVFLADCENIGWAVDDIQASNVDKFGHSV